MDKKQKCRTIIFYKSYFEAFFVKQREKVKEKIIWTFDLIEEIDKVPETYLKHLENTEGLYEIRVQQGSDIFRIFCFLTRDSLWYLLMVFKRRHKRHPSRKLIRL